MTLSIVREDYSTSIQGGNKFFYEQLAPETVTLTAPGYPDPGVNWYKWIQPTSAGYYRVSVSVRKISGDLDNVRIYAVSNQSGAEFGTNDTFLSGVMPFDPDGSYTPEDGHEYPFIALVAAIDTETLSATVEVSGYVCSWS